MKENNKEILIELLTKMKIETHFEHKDRLMTLKLTQLIDLFIKLIKILERVETEE